MVVQTIGNIMSSAAKEQVKENKLLFRYSCKKHMSSMKEMVPAPLSSGD